jgi:hypothetical protein
MILNDGYIIASENSFFLITLWNVLFEQQHSCFNQPKNKKKATIIFFVVYIVVSEKRYKPQGFLKTIHSSAGVINFLS